MRLPVSIVALGAVLAAPGSALADFSGQTILGPLTNGSSVLGSNIGSGDNNDGWFSGTHVFDLWNGGDNVYALNWAGGDLRLRMVYDPARADPDLFLYTPGNLDESSYDSYLNTGIDEISVPAAAPGTYYILVDSVAGTEGAYELNVLPTPGTLALLIAGLPSLARRSRRHR